MSIVLETRRLTKAFAGVHAIVHAGDVGHLQVLETLSSVAPVYAVCGNNDVALLKWAGLGIAMPHGRAAARAAAKRVAPPGDPETALARAVAALVTTGSGTGENTPDNEQDLVEAA